MSRAGLVQLVGAGPGDPELITVKGRRAIERAEVLVHDRLVSAQLIDLAPRSARRIDVGKIPGNHRWPQRRINTLLIAEARRGRRVVRLKGGDPFVFGRGGEECLALAAAGLRYEIVPGVTSAVAAPAYAGVPVSHRSRASAFTVVTGHTCDENSDLDWSALARVGTLVILMGLAKLPSIVRELRDNGRPATTDVTVVSRATTAEQVVVRGTLGDIVVRAHRLRGPATIVVGAVAALADRLSWFDPTHAPSCFAAAARGDRQGAEPKEDVVA